MNVEFLCRSVPFFLDMRCSRQMPLFRTAQQTGCPWSYEARWTSACAGFVDYDLSGVGVECVYNVSEKILQLVSLSIGLVRVAVYHRITHFKLISGLKRRLLNYPTQ